MPKTAKEVADILKNRDPKEVAAILNDREAWIVDTIPTTKTVPVGTAMYIMWSNEDRTLCTDFPTFEGDVRIAIKEAVDKSGTMLVFKDSYLKIVPNALMKKLAEISNKILNNAQEAMVYSKKIAHAELIVPPSSERQQGVGSDGEEDDDFEGDDEEEDEDVDEDENVFGGGGIESPRKAPNNFPQLKGSILVQESQATDPGLGGDAASKASTNAEEDVPSLEQQENEQESGGCIQNASGSTVNNPPSPPLDIEPQSSGEQTRSAVPQTSAMLHSTGALSNPLPPGVMQSGNYLEYLEIQAQVQELREATERMKAAKLFMKKWKKEQKAASGKREEKKRLEEQLKRVKLEVKLEDEAAKQQSTLETTKRKRVNDDDNSDSESDGFGMSDTKKKRVLTTVDKWQKGHRRAALSAANSKFVESVTVRTWAAAVEKMRTHGMAVVDDFVELFSPEIRPTEEQRDYILEGLQIR